MNNKTIRSTILLIGITLAAPLVLLAAEPSSAKLKPYPLKTCVVSGEKLGGDMGEPYAYKYQDREIKFCCKNCLKDFNKDSAKYVKKIEEAEKAGKRPKPAPPAQGHSGHQH